MIPVYYKIATAKPLQKTAYHPHPSNYPSDE